MKRLLVLALTCALAVSGSPCTIFLVARNGRVLMGANEDMVDEAPYDKHWVDFRPSQGKGRLGYVAFGYKAIPLVAQAGMNEAGLFFDYNALPLKDAGPHGKPRAKIDLGDRILNECKTVKEAIALVAKYDFVDLSAGQMVIGDATGDSAIIERNAVTRRGGADYQIGTNFRTSDTPKSEITCWRYKACDARLALKQKVDNGSICGLLKDTMPKDPGARTWYSTVCDLKAKKIWLFRKGDFSHTVAIDIRTELRKAQAKRTRFDMDALVSDRSVAYPLVKL